MREFAQWLVTSDNVRAVYAAVVVAAMVAPMVALAVWYHSRIGNTPGGRRLMDDQNSSAYRPDVHSPGANPVNEFKKAYALHTGIMSGRYGDDAKRLHVAVFTYCGLWLAGLALLAGLPYAIAWYAGY